MSPRLFGDDPPVAVAQTAIIHERGLSSNSLPALGATLL